MEIPKENIVRIAENGLAHAYIELTGNTRIVIEFLDRQACSSLTRCISEEFHLEIGLLETCSSQNNTDFPDLTNHNTQEEILSLVNSKAFHDYTVSTRNTLN